jgi:hypothetical protein
MFNFLALAGSTEEKHLNEISGSHGGEYEDGSLVAYCAV